MKIYKTKEALLDSEENKKMQKEMMKIVFDESIPPKRKYYLKLLVDLLFIGIILIFYGIFIYVQTDAMNEYKNEKIIEDNSEARVKSVVQEMINTKVITIDTDYYNLEMEKIVTYDKSLQIVNQKEKRPCLGYVHIVKDNDEYIIDTSNYCSMEEYSE